MPIKKTKSKSKGKIKKSSEPDPELKFSFKFFDFTDEEMCPPVFGEGYTQTLMQRLRDLSSWTVRQFTGRQDGGLRNHIHDWSKTTREDGFGHLNDHYSDIPAWQFCLTQNEHGRVHGLIIDDTFYIVWLDKDHMLYD